MEYDSFIDWGIERKFPFIGTCHCLVHKMVRIVK